MEIYEVDDAAFNWFLVTAGRKWKEFKATLKAQFFDEKITDEELKKKHGDRVNDTDWNFLIEHWRSLESEAQTEISKANCAKLGLHHTSGSKSFACSRHEMGAELGRPPRRDEIYIRTHTRKNGIPSQHAEPIINKLKSIAEARPELTERTIQQGDVFAAACGEKEPRGRVRALGLGPTPQDVGTPGLKCYPPTRLQMEVLARKKVENDKAALERQIAEMQEELQEARMERERRNMEIISQNGSNSRNHVSPRSEGHVDEAHHVEPFEDDAFVDNENSHHYDEDEYLVAPGRDVDPVGAPSVQCAGAPSVNRAAAPSVQCAAAPSVRAAALFVHGAARASIEPHRECSITSPVGSTAPSCPPRKNNAPPIPHDEYIGKEVILYAMLRSEAVAKGIIISTNPSNVLGGQPLGRQFCEVVVKVVLKRDTMLPRPYGEIETLADAHLMPVQWPYKRLKVSKASQSSLCTAAREERSKR